MKNDRDKNRDRMELQYVSGPYLNQSDADRTISPLIEDRVNLEHKPVELQIFFYFRSRNKCSQMAEELTEIGFKLEQVEKFDNDRKLKWSLTCLIEINFNLHNLDKLSIFLENLAEKFIGVYDGWEIEIPGNL